MRLRRERQAFDPHELGARRSDPELAALEPLPAPPKRFRPLPLLIGLFGVVLISALLQHGPGRNPRLPGSCTTPAFRLSGTSTKPFGVVRWAAVGPAGSAVVFGLDTTILPTSGARPGHAGKLAGPAALTRCAATGQFGVPASEGEHVITAYAVGAGGKVSVIGTAKLSVSPT